MDEDLLHVAVSHLDGVALLTVRGDIDAESVAVLQAVLDQLDVHTTIRIDMAGVGFMDSSAINAILTHILRMGEGQGSIRICQASTAVRRVVEITGLEAALLETQTNKTLSFENHRPPVDLSHKAHPNGVVDDVA